MCGIAGWVDFDRDLASERAVAQAMTDTMSCRGPDDEGLWLGRHVTLGHRRLAVIDLAGGRQPMVADGEGQVLAALTYSGEVYNYRQLRTELQSFGHCFRTSSDTEVVLRAFLQWGAHCVVRLRGMFAFAIWDARSDELVLFRDRLGIKPLYYYPTPHGVLFGSEPKAILANPLAEAVFGADGLRQTLTMMHRPGYTHFEGMRQVRPGHMVLVDRDGLKTTRYWSLDAREHTDDLATTVAVIRQQLDDIVTSQLNSDVPLCTLLSGGLDSSTITALAARAHSDGGAGPVRSFAVDFVESRGGTDAPRGGGSADAPYVAQFVSHVDTCHTDIVLDMAQLMDPSVRGAVLRAVDVPVCRGDLDTSLYALCQAIRSHCTVALSGEGADELFGGYFWFHLRHVVSVGTPGGSAYEGPRRRMLDQELVRKLDLDAYRAACHRDALAAVPRLPGEPADERRLREMSYLHLTGHLQGLLDRKDRVSMAVGLEVRVPYCDHELVEYVFNTPWSMKSFDGREKSLLRAAAKDLLPDAILTRPKSGYPPTRNPSYERALRAELAELLTNDDAPVMALLDVEAVRAELKAPIDPEGRETSRCGVEFVLFLNSWLAHHKPRMPV